MASLEKDTPKEAANELEEILTWFIGYPRQDDVTGNFDDTIKKLESLIESEKVKAVEESLSKSLTLLQDIMRENFMYRQTCGDLGEDVARMYAEYRELEPEREQFIEYYERRVKELESKEEVK